MRDLSRVSDKNLVVYALSRLGFGATPIENWGYCFAPEIVGHFSDINLANRAFSIWFPTILDFIASEPEIKRLHVAASDRGVNIDSIALLAYELAVRLRAIAELLSREEQIFIRDCRLQNVHGSLEYFVSEMPGVKWYSAIANQVVSEQIPEADLHYIILKPFNADRSESQAILRNRVTSSLAWAQLFKFWANNLTASHLRALVVANGASA